jgi:hypothetical protein
MKKRIGKRILMAALALAFQAAFSGCIAPSNASLMEMNRHGKWKRAESAGMAMIGSPGTLNEGGILETYFHVIYAKTRLGKKQDAAKLVSRYDEIAAERPLPPELRWLSREMAKLRDELGLLTPAQKALVAAMEENEKKNYAAAIILCDSVLADSSAEDIQRAQAQFVAAACEIRLGNAEAAEKRLAAFDALKSALPRGHQALEEEPFLRQGLAELEKGR